METLNPVLSVLFFMFAKGVVGEHIFKTADQKKGLVKMKADATDIWIAKNKELEHIHTKSERKLKFLRWKTVAWGYSSVGKHLPSTCEVLGSTPIHREKNNEKKKQKTSLSQSIFQDKYAWSDSYHLDLKTNGFSSLS